MKRFIQWLMAGMLLSASAGVMAAQIAYTSGAVHMRAGPNQQYPVVQIYGPGSTVAVQGCLSDYSWCDVIAGASRGWIYADYLVYPYQGRNAPVMTYGQAMGLAVVSFSIGTYWGSHYHNRPWYSQRSHWYKHPPQHRPRPPIHGRPPQHGGIHRPRPPHQGSGRPPQTKPMPGRPGGQNGRPPHQGGNQRDGQQ
ncbi:MAG: SH3 domain-containing protein [Pseudomonas sp.]